MGRAGTASGLGAHAGANLGGQARAEGVDLDRRTVRVAIEFAAGDELPADGFGRGWRGRSGGRQRTARLALGPTSGEPIGPSGLRSTTRERALCSRARALLTPVLPVDLDLLISDAA